MASLMEDLFTALSGEKEIYEKLIPVSEKKTEILTRGDLKELEEVTREEQALVEKATTLATLLEKQPGERKKIAQLHDELKVIMRRLVDINEKNKNLIENSLEMIEFNMNFIQSTRMSPGVNNYDRNASSSYSPGYTPGGFDAKQ